jgi:hypothetical protein
VEVAPSQNEASMLAIKVAARWVSIEAVSLWVISLTATP